jgi:hypothetical protein
MRTPRSRSDRLAVGGVVGVWALWVTFHPDGRFDRDLGTGPLALGLISLYYAWRALQEWAARRRLRR